MGVFVKRSVFECVLYVLGVLEPVGFLVVGKSSEKFSCEYFVFIQLKTLSGVYFIPRSFS